MAVNRRVMRGLAPEAVFDVLRDGRSYQDWVVGTRAIRDVEPGWPEVGTALHYTVGYGPSRSTSKTASGARPRITRRRMPGPPAAPGSSCGPSRSRTARW